MIVITGAAGFIASNLLAGLNSENIEDILIVDNFSNSVKNKNLDKKKYHEKVERSDFFRWLSENPHSVSFIFHLGARTDTTEHNKRVFDELNLGYSQMIWQLCTKYAIPLVYASSAATYGLGEYGDKDDHDIIPYLKPLNPYGESKNDFDKWVMDQSYRPPYWAGLKFFNVYGPNEYHKGRMASVIFHAYRQIKDTGRTVLFRSHNEGIADGEQKRDFIYIADIVKILKYFYRSRPEPGIYNAGTGTARSFADLAKATFKAIGADPVIDFIDTPEDIRDKYQYFTQADMGKLKHSGYNDDFTSLEEGVRDYVQNFLEGYRIL